MRPFLVIVAVAFGALLLSSAGGGATRELWPGVTYSSEIEFTPGGPVVLNVITSPRPGGTTTLQPVLSTDTVVGRETLTSMQRRLAGTATTAGVNGDLFSLATGRPSGVFLRGGDLANPPNAGRSSLGILSDGTLEVRRVAFKGLLTLSDGVTTRPLMRLNELPPANGVSLFTPTFGLATPPLQGATAAIVFPFPPATPGVDLPAPIAAVFPSSAPVEIPSGGAVLVARGASATVLASIVPGSMATVRVELEPGWSNLVSAIGGGPQIVRDGAPVFRAGETFLDSQLTPRSPRSAVGQTADGRVLLVAVDGRQPGYSVGLSNFQLGQALARLGATTAMALDGGGSSAMAFDGSVLNRPSGGAERAIASALLLVYTGVFLPEPVAVVSPDGDGVDDAQRLSYRVVRPSTVTATLTAPAGVAGAPETLERGVGSYPVALPENLAEGRWTLRVDATDDLGQSTTGERAFTVDKTLGFLRTERPTFRLPVTGGVFGLGWKLTRAAKVVATVETKGGTRVRRLAARSFPAGESLVSWDGRDRARALVPTGRYVLRVRAQGLLGAVEQTRPFAVKRVVR